MEFEIIWTEPAEAQLKEIHDYIAADNLAAANRVIAKIVKCVERLQSTPRIGAVFRTSSRYSVRKIVSGK